MRQLNYELRNLCYHNRDGAYGTQNARENQLMLCANQLQELGFRQLSAKGLKPKHVEALVQHWQEHDISPGTIKNRMSALRWWAEKIHKPSLIARDNDAYGIDKRKFDYNHSKAKHLTFDDLAKIPNELVRMSLVLQREFGLRREEAIKFRPSFADRGNKIVLKASWTKGGKERTIPITHVAQRKALNQAHQLVGKGSLIPPELKYIQQVKLYERHTAAAGLHRMHGLRHRYAQMRYERLTGWRCPAAGGPCRKQLSKEQRELDADIRLIISKELGHERPSITKLYLGR